MSGRRSAFRQKGTSMKTKFFIVAALIASLMACSKLSEEQIMEKAIDAQKGNQFEKALEHYQALLDTYPKSNKVPEALYAMGSIYQNQKEFAKAVGVYARIAKEYPEHATASSASFLVGFIYSNELKNYPAAKTAYEEFLQKYPSSPMASSAKFELDNLGKDPEEIIREKVPRAEQKPSKSAKSR